MPAIVRRVKALTGVVLFCHAVVVLDANKALWY
jgi:hypothetical protein